jgi:hypothetical protein
MDVRDVNQAVEGEVFIQVGPVEAAAGGGGCDVPSLLRLGLREDGRDGCKIDPARSAVEVQAQDVPRQPFPGFAWSAGVCWTALFRL